MPRRLTIDPLTRLEGHGRVEIVLDDQGEVGEAYFVVPELRGFEQLCIGRPVEEMPQFTGRICGLCPEAHHMAAAKALDQLFGVEPTPAARCIRELLYAAFVVSNHVTHFFALAGPDLLLAADVPRDRRSLFGVLQELGPELARGVLSNRVRNHEVIETHRGRRIQPVAALPGGWSRTVSDETRDTALAVGHENVAFSRRCLEVFHDRVLSRTEMFDVLVDDAYTQPTYSLGTVDEENQLQLYDGTLRVVDPVGDELLRFAAREFADHVTERTEPWTYLKLPYLNAVGWSGLHGGADSGIFAVGPLARLNVCDGLGTPLAQQAYDSLFSAFSERREDGRFRPIHHRLAIHAARLVEQLHAAEAMVELAERPELTDPDVRQAVPAKPVHHEAVGCVEAPRGTLVHRYHVDEQGIVREADLVVATTNNHAAIALSVTAAATGLIHRGSTVDDRLLDRIEIAIRAHDPCLACATHTFPGDMPLRVRVRDATGSHVATIQR
jgi:F420-non-reducing hydrogenase large subunit